MAKAKKLPSGSWRVQVFDHFEPIINPDGTPVIKNGKPVLKRIYQSFTDDDPSAQGRRRVELAAAQFKAEKQSSKKKKTARNTDMTLKEAANKYIDLCKALKRSPATIEDYNCVVRNGFPGLWDKMLKDINEEILQEAVSKEANRPTNSKKGKTISAKRLLNEWGLVTAVLHKYTDIKTDGIQLPTPDKRMTELLDARTVMDMVKGTDIELPVLLAMWLSFSASEIRGLTKSKSINGEYITIRETVITVRGESIRKDPAKNNTRKRRHKIPKYIKQLIDQVPGDVLVPLTDNALHHRWTRLQMRNGIKDPMTFHDLRHLSASVMALLRIPDKYAQERGGWKTDAVMKNVYMQTFPEARQKVDATIDNFFEGIINGSEGEKNELQDLINRMKKEDPDGWYKAVFDAMQHAMQHD